LKAFIIFRLFFGLTFKAVSNVSFYWVLLLNKLSKVAQNGGHIGFGFINVCGNPNNRCAV